MSAIDYRALAERIKEVIRKQEAVAQGPEWQAWLADLRTVVSLLEGMAEERPVAWMRPDNRVREESFTGKQFIRGEQRPTIGTWNPLYLHPAPQPQPAQPPDGAPYGIIDPDYGRVYTIARKLAWEEGYAIGLHGSFTRDLDMIAVPWADTACEPEHLIRRIAEAAGLRIREGVGVKPHGRLAWTLKFPAFGDPRFVDLSIMPRVLRNEREQAQEAAR